MISILRTPCWHPRSTNSKEAWIEINRHHFWGHHHLCRRPRRRLEREAERLKDASTRRLCIQGACEGLSLLAGLVDKAHDRAIESRAGLPVSPEPLDALIDAVEPSSLKVVSE